MSAKSAKVTKSRPEDQPVVSVPYYVVVPFKRDEEGDLWPDEPQEAPNSGIARQRARALVAQGKAGAVAFSRTIDPSTGDASEPVILAELGDVDLQALCE